MVLPPIIVGGLLDSIDPCAFSILLFFIAYLFTHLSLVKLRTSEPNTKRLFRVPLYPIVPLLGAVSCAFLMYYLSNNAKIASGLWFVMGLIVFLVLTRARRRSPCGFNSA